MRRSLPGAAERTTTATGTATCSTAVAVFAHAGRARSPTFSYRRQVQLRTTAYVFATAGDASQALSSYASKPSQTCIARTTTAALQRSGYTTAAPQTTTTTVPGIGQAAIASEVTIPSRSRGRTFTWHLDATAVRDGRVINVLDTLAGGSTAHYNQRLAKSFSKLATDAQ